MVYPAAPVPYVLTLEQVKNILGITDTTYDAKINEMLPVVTDFLCGKYGYLHNDFMLRMEITTTHGSSIVKVQAAGNIFIGNTLYSSAFHLSASVRVVQPTLERIMMTEPATIDKTEIAYFRQLPFSARVTVAKMVMFKVQQATIDAVPQDVATIKSKKYGPISVTFGDSSGAVGVGGYPESLIKALRDVKKVRFV